MLAADLVGGLGRTEADETVLGGLDVAEGELDKRARPRVGREPRRIGVQTTHVVVPSLIVAAASPKVWVTSRPRAAAQEAANAFPS
ncbi:hypothetical protein ACIQZO_17960 [Streptomyces sp. NPDC097617]|uniref:hypothetical protein n=1 Tax=Streptomyces sp. NPDC097617 TaxID=3366091 RepID=UPI00382AB902